MSNVNADRVKAKVAGREEANEWAELLAEAAADLRRAYGPNVETEFLRQLRSSIESLLPRPAPAPPPPDPDAEPSSSASFAHRAAVALGDTILENLERLADAGHAPTDFIDGVRDTTEGITASIKGWGSVTEPQYATLERMHAAVEKWL